MTTMGAILRQSNLAIIAKKSALTRKADDVARFIISRTNQASPPDLFLDIPDLESILIIIVTKKDARAFSISEEKLKSISNGTRCEFKMCLKKDLEEILNGIKTAGREVLKFNTHRFKQF